MGVVVFDSDVLIGFLNRDDAHHNAAVARVRASMVSRTRRLLCAVNYAEIMVGPLRAGTHERPSQMLVQFNIETIPVDMPLANRAASVRARTNLKLPDAFVLATAIHAEKRSRDDVQLESFDAAVLQAHRELHPLEG